MKYIGKILFDDYLDDATELVICGAGKDLESLWSALNEKGVITKVVAISDNNDSLYASTFNGVNIESYETVVKKYPQADYIVYNRFSYEIAAHLMDANIDNIHILRINQ